MRNAQPRRWLVALGAAVLLAPLLPATGAAAAAGRGADADPALLSEWNALAVSTISADPTKLPPETVLYQGFVQAAVYDAVIGVTGGYQPYRFHARAPRHASARAAAVAAAHRILVTYSPYATTTLDTAYAASLATIPDGRSKTDGVSFGTRAADHLIALRAHDGRNAPITFTTPPAVGVWRPTPPGFLAMFDPWLGAVTPLMLRSPAQFGEPGPPPAVTSARYTRDFAEVKALGSATSTARTAEQTSTALFFSGSALAQVNAALRNQVTTRHLDLARAARMFAAVDMSCADALISAWHAKLLYGFWRPITAITLADTDGNPATTADPSWTPLLTTPPYPEYVSGYNVVIAAFTRALAEILGTTHLRLTLTSTAVPGATRSYDSGAALRGDVVEARIWLGIHFRTADTAARDMGQAVARWSLARNFRPVH